MQGHAHFPLPWDDVRLFLALCRARTMGQAARALGVDPSTISRRLSGLEAALDTVLFDRGRDGLRLTAAAEALLPTAEIVEDGVIRFAHAADGLERSVSGTVRITAPPDATDVIVLPMLGSLLPQHPDLRVVLAPGEATLDLNRREADIALRIVRPTRGDLVVKRALQTRFVAATHPAAAARFAEALAGAEVPVAVPWIGWSAMGQVPSARWMAAHGLGEPVLRTDSLRSQIAAAAAGLGVALVPLPSVGHYGLTSLELGPWAAPTPPIDLFAVTHRALRRVPRVATVWQALIARLEAL